MKKKGSNNEHQRSELTKEKLILYPGLKILPKASCKLQFIIIKRLAKVLFSMYEEDEKNNNTL